MKELETIRLTVPDQELDQSSFFDSGGAAVNAWVAKLPMTNVGETTRMLFQALTELNTVKLLPSVRMAMLDQLRVPIYYTSNALSKHFLKQPILLPQKSQKVAALTFEMHQLLATGYLLVATHSIALASSDKQEAHPPIASALHRLITEHSRNIQRQLQLYQPLAIHSWRDLHQFYWLARQQNVLQQIVVDAEFGDCTVEESYIRILLLGCSKPNQLRQDDLERFFKPAAAWAAYCTLEFDDHESLFLVNLLDDKPAIYRKLQGSHVDPQSMGLNTKKLSEHLSLVRKNSDLETLNITIDNCLISNDLLSHLTMAWSLTADRSSIRTVTTGELEICVGLSATHHFLLGGASFESLVHEPGDTSFLLENNNPFMNARPNPSREKDVWDSPFKSNLSNSDPALQSIDYQVRNNKQTANTAVDKHDSYSVTIVNSSDDGYGLTAPDDTGVPLKAGEIIGIKKAAWDNWSTAVIRWVSHRRDDQSQLGIELISANASPYGAQIMAKKGDKNEYLRVILLPEIATINQQKTLLTAKFPFKTGQKLTLNQYRKRQQIKLGKKLNTTGSYNQFEIREVAILSHPTEKNGPKDDEFDSLWNKL